MTQRSELLLESLAIPDFDVDAWAAPMARHTGGNPMFILETLLAMLASPAGRTDASRLKLPAPAHIGQLIERRLDQLARRRCGWRASAHWRGRTSASSWRRPCSASTHSTSPTPGVSWKQRRSFATTRSRTT